MTEYVKPDWMEGFKPKPVANGGRWQKGQSGNPAGRPPGRPDARTKISRALLDDGHAVARVVIDAALDGDLQACQIILARIAPALKAQAERVQFDFDPTAPVTEQIEAVLAAVAEGKLAPDAGQTIIGSLGALSDARIAAELLPRLEALEEGTRQ
ncbi:DUF5681 domain-containing protein [Citromicrobium bathyomarinum]